MPRNVDPVVRRRQVVDAVWRVVRREGLECASVRAVAAESGLSMGSLRHYFASQSELHRFAMRSVMDDVQARIDALTLSTYPRLAAEQVLAELLPLDERRLGESEVWLAYTARALVDPVLHALRDEAYDQLQQLCQGLVTGLQPAALPVAQEQLEVQSEQLYALLDGLLLHGVVRRGRAGPDLLRRVLAAHLDTLAGRTDKTHAAPPAHDGQVGRPPTSVSFGTRSEVLTTRSPS